MLNRPKLDDLLQADCSKMTQAELIAYRDRMVELKKKDLIQVISDEDEGMSEHLGFIYILSHNAMPGLLKIGFTTGTVEKRASEIARATGVPGQFTIEKKIPVYKSPREWEKKIHSVLSPYRTAENREFFRLTLADACLYIQAILEGKFDEV